MVSEHLQVQLLLQLHYATVDYNYATLRLITLHYIALHYSYTSTTLQLHYHYSYNYARPQLHKHHTTLHYTALR